MLFPKSTNSSADVVMNESAAPGVEYAIQRALIRACNFGEKIFVVNHQHLSLILKISQSLVMTGYSVKGFTVFVWRREYGANSISCFQIGAVINSHKRKIPGSIVYQVLLAILICVQCVALIFQILNIYLMGFV